MTQEKRLPRQGSQPGAKTKGVREQMLLFTEEAFLSETLPSPAELRPAENLSQVFEECHNFIYANEGLLKEKIFHEIVKLLVMKLYDERHPTDRLRFGITRSEYRQALEGQSPSFYQRLNRLYAEVRRAYPALFPNEALGLSVATMAYVVARLQGFSLLRTPGDVKGEAFQAFVYRYQRGDRGEFFTPYPVVQLAVAMLAPQPHERVIDPACGSGGFLIETLRFIRRHHPDTEISAYIRANLRGIEFNPDVARSAMLRLAFEGGSGEEILCANALLPTPSLEGAFDVVLTNPPFGNRGKIRNASILRRFALGHRWENDGRVWRPSSRLLQGQAPEVLFIEKSLQLLRPGGRMGIVIPDGLLQNASSAFLRHWLREQAHVLGVVSLPSETFIPYGTGIKTSLLLLQKRPAPLQAKVFMARVNKIGYDVRGQPLYQRREKGEILTDEAGHPLLDEDVSAVEAAYRAFVEHGVEPKQTDIFTLPETQLNNRLDVEHYHPEDLALIERLREYGARPLGEIADIVKERADFRHEEQIRYIAISDVDARTMQVINLQILRPHQAPSRATYRVRQGDIITAISGANTGTPRQATAWITEEEDGTICSNGFAVLRNVRQVSPFYLLAYMRTPYFWRQVRRLLTGHAIPALSHEDLAQVLVPVPPEEVQQRIAEKVKRLLALRKAMAQTQRAIEEEAEAILREQTADQ